MDNRIKQEIYNAFLHVSQLCDQFFRKFPHYSYPYQGQYTNLNLRDYNQRPLNSHYEWQPGYQNQSYDQKLINTSLGSNNLSKKESKENKTVEKKIQDRKKSQEARQQKLKQIRKNMKDKMRTDKRFKEKPKYPTSPFFRFLREMRVDPQNNDLLKSSTNKQFAQGIGKKWREMAQKDKEKYTSAFVKDKKNYDEEVMKFYRKYPDLSPKWRLDQIDRQDREDKDKLKKYDKEDVVESEMDLDQHEGFQFEQFTPELKQGQTSQVNSAQEKDKK